MNDAPAKARRASTRVPTGLYLQTRFFAATAGLWRHLGELETSAVRDLIEDVPIARPIYVTSLPRSGTTIVTEMLEAHPEVTAHHYSDFPNVWTPYWRNYLLQRARRETPALQERAHRDRIRVSNDSPEAVEEVLWMHFFPGRHDPAVPQVLDADDRDAVFDAFYRDHIRKLLAVRGARRYLAKGNYNLSRLGYIHSLFPDARFLVPLRDPVHHVASLMKQHALFCRDSETDPRVALQLARSGHHEFGPLRSRLNLGDEAAGEAIDRAWAAGDEVEGWARYWAMTYDFLHAQLSARPELREACLLFRYEDLCGESEHVIDRILDHCSLPCEPFRDVRREYAQKLTLPDYYRPPFDDQQRQRIEQICAASHSRILDLCR